MARWEESLDDPPPYLQIYRESTACRLPALRMWRSSRHPQRPSDPSAPELAPSRPWGRCPGGRKKSKIDIGRNKQSTIGDRGGRRSKKNRPISENRHVVRGTAPPGFHSEFRKTSRATFNSLRCPIADQRRFGGGETFGPKYQKTHFHHLKHAFVMAGNPVSHPKRELWIHLKKSKHLATLWRFPPQTDATAMQSSNATAGGTMTRVNAESLASFWTVLQDWRIELRAKIKTLFLLASRTLCSCTPVGR